jgi:hypothetical protein
VVEVVVEVKEELLLYQEHLEVQVEVVLEVLVPLLEVQEILHQ